MDQSAAGDLPAETEAELRREVLALALRWRRLLGGPPATAEDAASSGPSAAPPGVQAALSRIVADLAQVAQGLPGPDDLGPSPVVDGCSGRGPWVPAGLLPDDPDLYALLGRVEQRLLRPLAEIFSAAGEPVGIHLAPPLDDGAGLLAAYRRVLDGVPPPGSARPLVGPNGRWKLVGLHVLPPRPAEVSLLEAALAELSAALAPLPLHVSRQAARRTLRHLAARAATTPEVLVGELARVLALLDMPADHASTELRALVSTGWPTVIRLDHRGAELYREFAKRTIPLVLEFDRVLPSLFDESTGEGQAPG